jgi:hypothetical protein
LNIEEKKMNYAIIEDNKVVNVVVSESALADNWIAVDNVSVGYTYENGEFKAPPVAPEILAEGIRSQRDSLLTASDWTQVDDAPVDKAAWATYRQSLRNVPQQDGFPTSIVWPVKPE